jgi:hypothetical protein
LVSFNVLLGNFFSPSYGSISGGEVRTLFPNYNMVVENVAFQNDTNVKFNCSLVSTQLSCISPSIISPKIKLFDSYKLILPYNNITLVVEYVIYEARNITYLYPTIIPKTATSITFNVTINKLLKMNAGEGVFFFGKNFQNVGLVSNSINFTTTIVSQQVFDNSPNFYFSYYNSKSSEIDGLIVISNLIPINVVDNTGTITFSSNNINYINLSFNVSVVNSIPFNNLKLSNIFCVINNNIITTYVVSTSEVICNVFSSTIKTDLVSLWYFDPTAYNNKFQLTSNSLNIYYIPKISILSLFPFGSLLRSKIVQISTNYAIDYFGSNLKYYCSANSILLSTATLSNSIFTCNITTAIIPQFQTRIEILVASSLNQPILFTIPSAFSKDIFYFMDYIQLLYVSPFANKHNFLNSGFYSNQINIQIDNPLITTTGVYCQITSSEGVVYKAPISFGLNTITCNFDKTIFTSQVEVSSINIYQNVSSININDNFILSKNNISYSLIRDNIKFNYTSSFIDQGIFTSQNVLLFQIPKNILPSQYFYTLNISYIDYSINTSLICQYTSNNPICTFDQNIFNSFKYWPIQLSFSFNIKYPLLSESITLNVSPQVYTNPIRLTIAYPFILSYIETKAKDIRIIFSTDKKLNRNMSYKCVFQKSSIVEQNVVFDVQPNEISGDADIETYFSCKFYSFNNIGTYNMSLKVIYQSENLILNSNTLSLFSISDIKILQPNIPYDGNTKFQEIELPYLPTSINNYNYSIKIINRNRYIDFGCEMDNFDLNCNTTSISSIYSKASLPVSVSIGLFINQFYSFTFQTKLQYYDNPKITSSPNSKNILKNTNGFITYFISGLTKNLFYLKIIYYNGFESSNFTCSLINDQSIQCPTPNFNNIGNVSIKLYYYEDNIIQQNFNLYIYPTPIIKGISKEKLFLNETSQNITMFGEFEFLKTNKIIIKITDGSSSYIVDGFSDSKENIVFTLPLFLVQLYKSKYNIYISLDLETQYFTNNTLTLSILDTQFSLFPIKAPLYSKINNLNINYPNLNLNLFFQLDNNYNDIINLTCSSDNQICNMTSSFQTTKNYYLKTYYENKLLYVSPINSIAIYADTYSVTSQPNNTFVIDSLNPFILTSKNFVNGDKYTLNIDNSYYEEGVVSNNNIYINSTSLSKYLKTRPQSFLFSAPSIEISVSFNFGFIFQTIKKINYIEKPLLNTLYNFDTQGNTFYTFLKSQTVVEGSNFPNLPIKIVLSTPYLSRDYYPSNYTYVSSNQFLFISADGNDININYVVNYPYILNVGITYNDYDYMNSSIFIFNIYESPSIFQILPTVVAENITINITVQGLQLQLMKDCIVKLPNFYGEFITKYYPTNEKSMILCEFPAIPLNFYGYDQNFITTSVFLRSHQLTQSQGSRVRITTNPTFLTLSPKNGPGIGNTIVTITGLNISENDNFKCQVGGVQCLEDCLYQSKNVISCKTPPNIPSVVDFYLSFNNFYTQYKVSESFTYNSCPEGQETPDYTKIPCTNCNPGYFKEGFLNQPCIKCFNNTYTDKYGSVNCTQCKGHTTTISLGSESTSNCVCISGYYLNTSETIFSNSDTKCVLCPIGGNCDMTGTIYPVAKAGYWNSILDNTT